MKKSSATTKSPPPIVTLESIDQEELENFMKTPISFEMAFEYKKNTNTRDQMKLNQIKTQSEDKISPEEKSKQVLQELAFGARPNNRISAKDYYGAKLQSFSNNWDFTTISNLISWKDSNCPPLSVLDGMSISDVNANNSEISYAWEDKEKYEFNMNWTYTLGELFDMEIHATGTRFTKFDSDGLTTECITLNLISNDDGKEDPFKRVKANLLHLFQTRYRSINNTPDSKNLLSQCVETYFNNPFQDVGEFKERIPCIPIEKKEEFSNTIQTLLYCYFYYTRNGLFSLNAENLSITTLVKFTNLDRSLLLRDFQYFVTTLLEYAEGFLDFTTCEPCRLNESEWLDRLKIWFESKVGIPSNQSKFIPNYSLLNFQCVEVIFHTISIVLQSTPQWYDYEYDGILEWLDQTEYDYKKSMLTGFSIATYFKNTFEELVLKKACLVSIQKRLKCDLIESSSTGDLIVSKITPSPKSWIITPQKLLNIPCVSDNPTQIILEKGDPPHLNWQIIAETMERKVNTYVQDSNQKKDSHYFLPIANNAYPYSIIQQFLLDPLVASICKWSAHFHIKQMVDKVENYLKSSTGTNEAKEKQFIPGRTRMKKFVAIGKGVVAWARTRIGKTITAEKINRLNKSIRPENCKIGFQIYMSPNYLPNLLILFELHYLEQNNLSALPFPKIIPKNTKTTTTANNKIKNSTNKNVIDYELSEDSADFDHSSLEEGDDCYMDSEDSDDESYQDTEKKADIFSILEKRVTEYIDEEEIEDEDDLAARIEMGCEKENERIAEEKKIKQQKRERQKQKKLEENLKTSESGSEENQNSLSTPAPVRRSTRERFSVNKFTSDRKESDQEANERHLRETEEALKRAERQRLAFISSKESNPIDEELYEESHKHMKKKEKVRESIDLTANTTTTATTTNTITKTTTANTKNASTLITTDNALIYISPKITPPSNIEIKKRKSLSVLSKPTKKVKLNDSSELEEMGDFFTASSQSNSTSASESEKKGCVVKRNYPVVTQNITTTDSSKQITANQAPPRYVFKPVLKSKVVTTLNE